MMAYSITGREIRKAFKTSLVEITMLRHCATHVQFSNQLVWLFHILLIQEHNRAFGEKIYILEWTINRLTFSRKVLDFQI